MKAWVRSAMLLAILTPSLTGTARAQRLTLTITAGSPVAFPAVTEAMYDAGSVSATTALGYTLNLQGGGGGGLSHTGSLQIRSASATMGGTKPIGDLQWRRGDLATWNSLTTTDVTVQSNTMIRNGLNDPYSNTIVFRTLLSWSTDGPAIYTPTIVVTATLTTP